MANSVLQNEINYLTSEDVKENLKHCFGWTTFAFGSVFVNGRTWQLLTV